MTSDEHKRTIRQLPDITAARQDETVRDFKDLLGHFNQEMTSLGLCDGNSCVEHQIIPGGARDMCRCKKVSKAHTKKEKRYWQKMHFENCSANKSAEKNLGCPGYKVKGTPLYQQAVMGRRII